MILFLDYDGVLHPNEAYMTKQGVILRCDGHNLFEHAELLAGLLEPFPQVRIVLSTSWVWALSFSKAKDRLPEPLPDTSKPAAVLMWRGASSGRIGLFCCGHGLKLSSTTRELNYE